MMEQVNDNSIFSHISSYHFEYVPLRYWMGSFFSVYSDRNVHRTCILQYFITNFHEFLKWTYFLAKKCSLTFVFTLSHVADNSFFFFFFFYVNEQTRFTENFFNFTVIHICHNRIFFLVFFFSVCIASNLISI